MIIQYALFIMSLIIVTLITIFPSYVSAFDYPRESLFWPVDGCGERK